MRRRKRTTPRFWLLVIGAVLIVFFSVFAAIDQRIAQCEANRLQLETQQAILQQREKQLLHDVHYAESQEGIQRMARSYGMIFPEEVRYTEPYSNEW